MDTNKALFNKGAFDYRRRPDFIPEGAYLLDTHSHTLASDGLMTPEQNIKWHIANGFDAFVVTDHNSSKNNQPSLDLQEKYPEILIIPGFEWTTSLIHLNFIGVENYPKNVPMNPSTGDVKEAIQKAHECGAVVQCDHISWTTQTASHKSGKLVHPARDELVAWGVDGFEINNEMYWIDGRSIHFLDELKERGNLSRPLFLSSGTDVHDPSKSFVTGWTELLLTDEERKNVTTDVVKKALLEGRTKVWMDHDYFHAPESTFKKKFIKDKPLIGWFYRFGEWIYMNPAVKTARASLALFLLYFLLLGFYYLLSLI
ncbi:MAG: PHP domain-containing protein [Promethearchaeota archaeon]